jgi:hypothetical protein
MSKGALKNFCHKTHGSLDPSQAVCSRRREPDQTVSIPVTPGASNPSGEPDIFIDIVPQILYRFLCHRPIFGRVHFTAGTLQTAGVSNSTH